MTRKLYQRIASAVQAMANCKRTGNDEWFAKHEETIVRLVKEYLPSGSGFDNASAIYVAESSPNRLVFATSFHHMDQSGYYDGWTDHMIIVTPDLASGFNLRVTGRDRNETKDYIADMFQHALDQEIDKEAYAALVLR